MSTSRVAALGGGLTFILAAIAGVVGNQLSSNNYWTWVAFTGIIIVGAAITFYITSLTGSKSSNRQTVSTNYGHVTQYISPQGDSQSDVPQEDSKQ